MQILKQPWTVAVSSCSLLLEFHFPHKTPFTEYHIQINPTYFCTALPFHLHDDDDKSDIQSTRL